MWLAEEAGITTIKANGGIRRDTKGEWASTGSLGSFLSDYSTILSVAGVKEGESCV